MPRSRLVELAGCAVYSSLINPGFHCISPGAIIITPLQGFKPLQTIKFGTPNIISARRSPFRDPIAIGWGVLPFRVLSFQSSTFVVLQSGRTGTTLKIETLLRRIPRSRHVELAGCAVYSLRSLTPGSISFHPGLL